MSTRWGCTGLSLSLGLLAAASSAAAGGFAAPAKPGGVTFTEDVAPIVFQNCTSCHRPGEGTPFSLMSYQDVKKRGHLIQSVTADGYMPPWPPAAGWGHFQDERRLTAAQVDTL